MGGEVSVGGARRYHPPACGRVGLSGPGRAAPVLVRCSTLPSLRLDPPGGRVKIKVSVYNAVVPKVCQRFLHRGFRRKAGVDRSDARWVPSAAMLSAPFTNRSRVGACPPGTQCCRERPHHNRLAHIGNIVRRGWGRGDPRNCGAPPPPRERLRAPLPTKTTNNEA
jgi:hypothetical protein